MRAFSSTCVSATVEAGVASIALADAAEGPSSYLLLQRTLEPDEKDRTLGLVGVYVELGSQHRSGYGGVESIELDGAALCVRLGGGTAERVGASAIRVALVCDEGELDVIRRNLRLIAGDDVALLM
ncbi:MAG: Imm10 family immunity protein [Phycisphaerales bacterium]